MSAATPSATQLARELRQLPPRIKRLQVNRWRLIETRYGALRCAQYDATAKTEYNRAKSRVNAQIRRATAALAALKAQCESEPLGSAVAHRLEQWRQQQARYNRSPAGKAAHARYDGSSKGLDRYIKYNGSAKGLLREVRRSTRRLRDRVAILDAALGWAGA
jgi:hypothetical protein